MVAGDSARAERLLAFRVGRGRFAVPLESVLGVQDPAQIVAGGGAVAFRGGRVLAIDLCGLGLGGDKPAAAPGAAVAIIVEGGGTGSAALIVDRAEGITAGSAMQPLPGLVAPFVRGVVRGVALDAEGGRLVVDPAALAAMAGKRAAGGGRGGPEEA